MKPFEPRNVKVLFSIFSGRENLLKEIIDTIRERVGEIDYCSPLLEFNQTSYYEIEFGRDLKRYIFSLLELRKRDCLIEMKWLATKLENEFSRKYNSFPVRVVNIDPGYINSAHLVLATHKDFSHRIYLGNMVFADLTLIRTKKEWTSLDWTYPDYASDLIQKELNIIRNKYLKQLKTEDSEGRSESPVD